MGLDFKTALFIFLIALAAVIVANRSTSYKSYGADGSYQGTSKPSMQSPASNGRKAPKRR